MDKQKNAKPLAVAAEEKLLRIFLQELLMAEGPVGASLTNPQEPKGFYSYDLSMGDTQSKFWYKSPGRSMGSDGDPGRPSDAQEYIGLKIPSASSPESSGSPEGIEASSGEPPIDIKI